MVAAIASVLFMLVACAGYLLTVTVDPASLPIDQRAMVEAQPMWMMAAYAIAVWVGLAGAVMLVLRRKLARAVAAGVAGRGGGDLPALCGRARRSATLVSTNEIAAALVVLAITWTIFWFARHSTPAGVVALARPR